MQVVNASVNGAGYVSPGDIGLPFAAQAASMVPPTADLVIVFGSDNDLGEDPDVLDAEAVRTFRTIHDRAPSARIVVVGPPEYEPNSPDVPALEQVRDVLAAAAEKSGEVFVDPIALRWFQSDVALLIGDDGEHPTEAGHLYLADRMQALVADYVTSH